MALRHYAPNAIPLHDQKSSCCPPPAAHRPASSYCTASAKNIRERGKRDAKRGLYLPMLPVLAKLRGPDKLRSTFAAPERSLSSPSPSGANRSPLCHRRRRRNAQHRRRSPPLVRCPATLGNLLELNLPPRFHALHSATSMEHAPLFRLGSRVPHSNAFPPDLHPRIRAILTFYFPPSTPTPTPHRRSFSIAAAPSSTLLHPPPLPLPAQLYFIRLGLN